MLGHFNLFNTPCGLLDIDTTRGESNAFITLGPRGPRAVSQSKAQPQAKSQPEDPLSMMNTCSTMEI